MENEQRSLALQQASIAKDIQLKDAEIELKKTEADKSRKDALYTEALTETENELREARKKTQEQLVLYQTNEGTKAVVWEKSKWELEWLGLGTFTAKPKEGDYTTGIFTVLGKKAFAISRGGIKLNGFNLANIDNARMTILANASDYNVPVSINTKIDFMPYTLSVANEKNDNKIS